LPNTAVARLVVGVKRSVNNEHSELLERLVVSQLLSQYTDTHFDTRAVGYLQTPAIKLPSHLLIVHCRLVLAVETQQRNGEKQGGTGRNKEE